MPKKKTPMKAIRAHCVECGGNMVSVRTCTAKSCNLWPFRFGMSLKRYEKKKAWKRNKKDSFSVGKEGAG